MKQITCNFMEATELESLVQAKYGVKDYSFVATQECGNYCCILFRDVNGKIDSFDQEDATEIIEKKRAPIYNNRVVLNLLCKDGHIAPGDYLIDPSW